MDSEAITPSNIDYLESEVHSAIFRSKLDLLQDMAQLLKVEKTKFQGKARSVVAKLKQTEEDKTSLAELNSLKEEMKKLEMKQKAKKEDLENKMKALKHADKSVSKAVLENSDQKQNQNILFHCQIIAF